MGEGAGGLVAVVVDSVSEQVGTEDSTAGKKGGRLGPERVAAAGNGGRRRAAMILPHRYVLIT